jgi:uncharacterized RDD family membrane protein YckC
MLDTARRVATPEGIELTLRLAGPVPRAMAWAIDLAVRAGIVLAVMMIALQFGRAGWGVVLLTLFFVEWLLPAWLETVWRGQTPGKRIMRLAVLNDDGTPVRWPSALTRNLLRAVDFLPFLYGVGLVSMLLNRDFKRLGDLAARTVVVYRETVTPPLRLPEATPRPPPVRFTLAEQQAILAFAARVPSLTNERAEELASIVRDIVRGEGDVTAGLLGYARHIAGER